MTSISTSVVGNSKSVKYIMERPTVNNQSSSKATITNTRQVQNKAPSSQPSISYQPKPAITNGNSASEQPPSNLFSFNPDDYKVTNSLENFNIKLYQKPQIRDYFKYPDYYIRDIRPPQLNSMGKLFDLRNLERPANYRSHKNYKLC